jgi:hypothetical protein
MIMAKAFGYMSFIREKLAVNKTVVNSENTHCDTWVIRENLAVKSSIIVSPPIKKVILAPGKSLSFTEDCNFKGTPLYNKQFIINDSDEFMELVCCNDGKFELWPLSGDLDEILADYY